MNVDMNTCRVCFEKKQRSCSINIGDICCHKLTIKEAIIQLVPEMAQTLVDDDYICKICLKSLRFCIRFIEKCRYIQLEFVANENRCHRDLDAFSGGRGETSKRRDGNHENTNSKDEAHSVDHNYSVTLDPKRLEPMTLHDATNIEEHDKILSVEQPRGAVIPEFLDSLRAGGVKILQYVGADVTLPKRVLLLGSTVRLECPECGAQFLTETALNRHTTKVHEAEATKQGSALCDKDGNKLGEADKLAVAKKSLRCAKCKEPFASFGEYRRHVQQCQWRRCPHCGLALDRRRQFRKHVLAVHGDDRPFKCRQCGKSYKKYSTYSAHSRGHKGYACGACGRVYKVKVSLQRHKERCGANGAAVDKRWSSGVKVCGTCGREFVDGKQFLKHKQTHVRMVCDVCGKCFNGAASLRVHILSHNSYDSAICEACGKGFKTRCALNHHLRTHYSARQQACDRCPKRFLFRNALLAHIKRAHDKLKDVACDACDKTFHTKSMMQQHYRAVHLKVRPFKCPICEREFSRKLNMQTHMRVHDKEKQVTAPENPENTGADTEIDQTAQLML